MDERGYIAQAFLDRLEDDGVAFRVLDEGLALAVPRDAVAGMPRRIARFCQDLDLHLVQLVRAEKQGWRFVLAWKDEVGQPSFLALHVVGDYYRAARRLLGSEELMGGAPDVLFLYGLVEGIEQQHIDEARAARIMSLWHSNPRSAIERIARLWRQRRDRRLLAQAARKGDWGLVRADLPRLRRALHRAVMPNPLSWLRGLLTLMRPPGATVAFIGAPEALRERVARDTAPAGVTTFAQEHSGEARSADVAVVFDPPEGYRPRFAEVITVDGRMPAAASAAQVEDELLRWLEYRVQRWNTRTVVGENPLAARILQFAARHNVPVLADFMGTLLNCGIYCKLGAPVLMPHPFGIFIHRNAVIGSRVTVMHQVTLGNQHPADPGAPHIEDNVYIGAGAKVLGAVRVGRGATVGANAVVTRDVPSHCTVVGANRILGMTTVAGERQNDPADVVNT